MVVMVTPHTHIHACMQLCKLKERMKEVMGQVQQVERRMEDVRGYKSKVRCCPVCSMTVNILLALQLGSNAVSCPGSFVVNHWAVRGGRPGAFHTLCGKQMAHCCCPSVVWGAQLLPPPLQVRRDMHHVLDRMYARLDEHSKSRLQQLGGMCMCGCVGVCKGIHMGGYREAMPLLQSTA